MTDEELTALEHANWIAYLTGVVACTPYAKVTRASGVVSILTGLLTIAIAVQRSR